MVAGPCHALKCELKFIQLVQCAKTEIKHTAKFFSYFSEINFF